MGSSGLQCCISGIPGEKIIKDLLNLRICGMDGGGKSQKGDKVPKGSL
jgi:hypothetical protein